MHGCGGEKAVSKLSKLFIIKTLHITVTYHELAEFIIKCAVLWQGRFSQLRKCIGPAVQSYGADAVQSGILVLFHVVSHAVLKGGDVGGVKYEAAVSVWTFGQGRHN